MTITRIFDDAAIVNSWPIFNLFYDKLLYAFPNK